MSDVTVEQFEKIVALVGDKTVKPIKSSNNADKLRFYALFKRATLGKLLPPYDDDDKDTDSRPKSRPGMLALEARAKYDAWKDCQDMTKQQAMNEYCANAKDKIGGPVEEVLNA
eukprot:CAMPEP_0116562656 /NCGR_PEP_ID=MMETSP0397-20121206/12288_1 /TAXON_ID=216820 /ORGANISM="Cyclophora tenuis, Strain ECT3854" /LENGTH=113 /DNA_ID=CAMNT_0004088991 /DNA_START=80 /DNA_END=421 /DNA_ORIENTATION=-